GLVVASERGKENPVAHGAEAVIARAGELHLAVSEVAHEAGVGLVPAARGGTAGNDDLAVALDGHPVRLAADVPRRIGRLSAAGEAQVGRAVRVVASDGKEDGPRDRSDRMDRTADDEDLPVVLEVNPPDLVGAAEEIGPDVAAGAEAGVQGAVSIEAGEREV